MPNRNKNGCVALLLAAGLAFGLSGADTAKAQEEGDGEPPAYTIDGSAAVQYVYRRAEAGGELAGLTAEDRDLFMQLRLNATLPETKRYEIHVHAAARRDLDGNSGTTAYSPFEDIGDTWSSDTSAQLYEAHFDVNKPLRIMTQLRLGRQAGTRDEPIYFDGVAADMALSKHWRTTVYGGYAVHFFELKHEATDDSLAGAGLDYLPVPATEISLDYLATRDLRDPDATRDDRLTSLRWRQHISQNWRTSVKARSLNGETRDGRLRVLGFIPAAELTVSAVYFRQVATLNELTTEEDPFSDVLGVSHPYHTIDLRLRWQPADDYAFDVGWYQRKLLEEQDQGPFNREFSRAFGVVEVDQLLLTGFSMAVTAERWETLETKVDTAGLDLGYRTGNGRRAGRINAGTMYTLYVYDHYLELGERTGVRTHYVKAQWPLGDSFSVSGRYERETGLETFDTVKLGTRYEF